MAVVNSCRAADISASFVSSPQRANLLALAGFLVVSMERGSMVVVEPLVKLVPEKSCRDSSSVFSSSKSATSTFCEAVVLVLLTLLEMAWRTFVKGMKDR